MNIRNKFKKMIKHLIYKPHFMQKHKMKNSCNLSENYIFIYHDKNKTNQYIKLIDNINIYLKKDHRFIHWIDEDLRMFHMDSVIGNIPPNYSFIVDNSIESLYPYNNELINAIKRYINRVIVKIKSLDYFEKEKFIKYFENMITGKANSLEEALQRILFWSSLFWQTGHKLVGLGRLDLVLDRFSNLNTEEEQIDIITDFISELHDYYNFKSNNLPGDIGQIIIIGGKSADDSYFSNSLTYSFIKSATNLKYSDPKILLRVSKNMPEKLFDLAVDCISTGIGSPLLSNDDIVINSLIDFGYEKNDAYNYATSACWEPVSFGNSLEQNNITNINFANVMASTIKDKVFKNVLCFEDVLIQFKDKLKLELNRVINYLDSIIWEEDPLFSLFINDCNIKGIDIAYGGAKYNDYGVLSIGLANAIDSLMLIDEMVFKSNTFKLIDIYDAWHSNNELLNSFYSKLSKCKKYFGHDHEMNIKLTNEILNFTNEYISKYRNKFGGKCKFGLSSPSYIDLGKNTFATFDGRKSYEATAVNISSVDNVSPTELISFASSIEYHGTNSNGNVIDFFVSPSSISNHKDSFKDLIKGSIINGFFQMQVNVVNSDILIDAKANPEKHLNLVVRVWGFSAYFNDLPDEYKDTIIKRCLVSEGKWSE